MSTQYNIMILTEDKNKGRIKTRSEYDEQCYETNT